jgi:hypothetical protein
MSQAVLIWPVDLPRMFYAVGPQSITFFAYLSNDPGPSASFHATLRLGGAQITTYASIIGLGFLCVESAVEFPFVLDHPISVAVCNTAHHF